MKNLALIQDVIPAMSERAIDKVREFESYVLQAPQKNIPTSHVFHAGLYARTIRIPAGDVLTGALIKIPTILTIFGHCIVCLGDETREINGYYVFAASSGRKQAFFAKTDTFLTMSFATNAKTVQEAEQEFTDEFENLMSRHVDAINDIVVTGE